MQDINFIKAKATVAAEFLANQGIDVKHGVILEMLSRLEGYRNWSTFRTQLAVTPAVSEPPTTQQALTMCYRWLASAEPVEHASGEAPPTDMAARALAASGAVAIEPAAKSPVVNTAWSPLMGPMTDAHYLARGGCRCPSCGSYSVEGDGRTESENGEAWQNLKCGECEASWTDVYTLSGYDNLEGGIDLENVESVVADVKQRARKYGFSVNSEAQAREAVEESCDLIEPLTTKVERKLAVMQLTS